MTEITTSAARGAREEDTPPTRLQRIRTAQKELEALRDTTRKLNHHLLTTSASLQRQLKRLHNQLRP